MNPTEMRVARVLESQLPQNAVVLPNFRWQKKKRNRAAIDLETDAIIFWPGRGVIILEIKGGPVSFDANTDTWNVISRSPTEQARFSRYDLCKILSRETNLGSEKSWKDRLQAFPLFPDVCREDFPESVDGYKKEHILGRLQLQNLGDVLRGLTDCTRDNSAKLTEGRCLDIAKTLCPSFEVFPRAAHILEDEKLQIDSAVRQQLGTVDLFIHNQYLFINGPAGTGKTILAMSVMKTWLAESYKIHYVTRNPYLAASLRKRFPELEKMIHSIADFCEEVLGVPIRSRYPCEETDITEAMINVLGEPRLDGLNVIVDESQDFGPDVLEALVSLCKFGRLWVLFDDQQVLTKGITVQEFKDSLTREMGRQEISSIHWKKNLRNTIEIANYAAKFVKIGSVPAAGMPQGVPPDIRWVSDEKSHDSEFRKILNELLVKRDFLPNDIVVLSCLPERQVRQKYTSSDSHRNLGRQCAYLGEELPEKAVRVASVLDFKGMEAPVAILVDTKDAEALNAFYIGGSRAIHRLYVIVFQKEARDSGGQLSEAFENAGFSI